MKRISLPIRLLTLGFVLLNTGLLINACDDGDLVFEELDFGTVIPARCLDSDLLYKVDETQAMIIEINDLDSQLPTEPSPLSTPKIIPITGTAAGAKVVYRLFNGSITQTNICATIQPANPTVIDEWNATSGNIQITTSDVKIPNTEEGFEGGEKIISLRHAILFKPITFQTNSTPIVHDTLSFGNLTVTRNVPSLVFGADKDLQLCDNGTTVLLYNALGNKSLTLEINSTLLSSVPLGVDTNVGELSDTNKLSLNVFASTINLLSVALDNDPETDYCDLGTLNISPIETWVADAGVPGVSGMIWITKTADVDPNDFIYTIHLSKVTLRKGTSSFLVATDFYFGDYFENN